MCINLLTPARINMQKDQIFKSMYIQILTNRTHLAETQLNFNCNYPWLIGEVVWIKLYRKLCFQLRLLLFVYNILYMYLITGCEIGTFGKGCSNRCSGYCLDNVPCNPTTGHCNSGCASGYEEPFCNKSIYIMNYYIFEYQIST